MLNIEEYLKKLKLNAVIYDDEIMGEIDYPELRKYIFSLDFLKALHFKVMMNILTQEFDSHVIDNIRNVLNYIRFNGVNNSFIPLINQMIIALNSSKCRRSNVFYKVQYLERSGILDIYHLSKNDLHLYNEELNGDTLKTIRDYITLDHDILDTLLYSSDDEFKKNIKEYAIESFLSTINLVMYECKTIFENDLVKKRVNYVLKHINELHGKGNLIDKVKALKLMRQIKK